MEERLVVTTQDNRSIDITADVRDALLAKGLLVEVGRTEPSGLVGPPAVVISYRTELTAEGLRKAIEQLQGGEPDVGAGDGGGGTGPGIWSIEQYVSPGMGFEARFPGMIDTIHVSHQFQTPIVVYGGVNRNYYNAIVPDDAKEGQSITITGKLRSGQEFSAKYVVKNGDLSSNWFAPEPPKQLSTLSGDANVWTVQQYVSPGKTAVINFPTKVTSINKSGLLEKRVNVWVMNGGMQVRVEFPPGVEVLKTVRVYGTLANGKEFSTLYVVKEGGYEPIWEPPLPLKYASGEEEPQPQPQPQPEPAPTHVVELSPSEFSAELLIDGKKIGTIRVSVKV